MAEDTQMLNPRQVAEILGVHQKTVHLWLRSGRLQGVKISYRAWRIPRAALDIFIANNSNARSPQQTRSRSSHQTPASTQKNGQKQITHTEPDEVPPQLRMKHYIRDIMGEQTPEE